MKDWQMGRDSNPGDPLGSGALAGHWFRPLTHPSTCLPCLCPGRNGRTRTSDILNPNQARYLAALRSATRAGGKKDVAHAPRSELTPGQRTSVSDSLLEESLNSTSRLATGLSKAISLLPDTRSSAEIVKERGLAKLSFGRPTHRTLAREKLNCRISRDPEGCNSSVGGVVTPGSGIAVC